MMHNTSPPHSGCNRIATANGDDDHAGDGPHRKAVEGYLMFKRSALRASLALTFALSSLVVVAVVPATAAVDSGCVGKCGYYEVYDSMSMPGAKCVYRTSYPYNLKEISVRPPLMHGDYINKTPVAWRFRVQRQSVGGGSWSNYFTSSYQQSTASDSIPAYANHGFSRRTWTASGVNMKRFRIVLDLRWKRNGSVEGTAKVRYTVYNKVRGNDSDKVNDYCIQSY
jgi:hypothetical protein